MAAPRPDAPPVTSATTPVRSIQVLLAWGPADDTRKANDDIGVFDSGVGGLSVLTEIRRLLPEADLTYLADRANAPYGQRSLEEVRSLAEACTDHLLGLGMDSSWWPATRPRPPPSIISVARHPEVPFVGMEPAIKPAALRLETRSSESWRPPPPSRVSCLHPWWAGLPTEVTVSISEQARN